MLYPQVPIDSVTRHDTGIVYLLIRERGDRTKLSVLHNLFFNAVAYGSTETPPSKKTTIKNDRYRNSVFCSYYVHHLSCKSLRV